jgi:SGNH domain (fused to AT3 domains)
LDILLTGNPLRSVALFEYRQQYGKSDESLAAVRAVPDPGLVRGAICMQARHVGPRPIETVRAILPASARRALLAMGAIAAIAWAAIPVGMAGAAHPPCYGAQARNPAYLCSDPALRFAVSPTPSEAQIMPNTPCAPIAATPEICAFGVPAAESDGTIALVGDSHAWQWRGAVAVLAQALHRQALSITRFSCPFTAGIATTLSEPKDAQCAEWNRSVIQWFWQHPEVSTVFVSNHPGLVMTAPGESVPAAQVAGISAAWSALPPTVEHIVVIRDTPYMREYTLACVERAITQHLDAGRACAVPRHEAQHYDPDLIVARRLRSPRVGVVDLTHFFCDRRLCYPVIGGALVYKDADHLTSVFATTLGPFLLRQVTRLMDAWSTSGVRTAPPSHPRCFGAAARDGAHPCENPKLRLAVTPTPREAQILPNAPCRPIEPVLNVCGFGVPADKSTDTVGLLGNSHAAHWRAALEVVARALGWQGLSITRSSCPFMRARIDLPEPERAACTSWNRGVVRWFHRHPEVGTVFVSDQPTPPLVVSRGRSLGVLAAQVSGYIDAWHELPATVKHIVVIRDNPYSRTDTLACIERARARREPAGERCAIPRGQALKSDPAVIAARRLHSSRVQIIDLTRFFCDSRLCYPVIGGALVYRDVDHLTRVFATTLGPYLLREVRRLRTPRRHRD